MMKPTNILWSILASVAIASSVLPITAHAIAFSSISQVYFFGDSLTDSGFNNTINFGDPTKAHTFTTYGGYTWAQYVAHDIKGFALPVSYPAHTGSDTITNNTTPTNGDSFGAVDPVLDGINYACGGSTTGANGFGFIWAPSLHQQITNLLASHPSLDPNALYFIWSGANDIFSAISPEVTDVELLQAADTATTNIASEIATLSAHGAKRFVVMSLPNIGSTPYVVDASVEHPELPGLVKNLSFTFDTMLNEKLGGVIKKYQAKILYINVYRMLDELVADTKAGRPYISDGKAYMFVNATKPSCGAGTIALFCDNNGVNNYVFADAIHPTDLTHQVLAREIEHRIKAWS